MIMKPFRLLNCVCVAVGLLSLSSMAFASSWGWLEGLPKAQDTTKRMSNQEFFKRLPLAFVDNFVSNPAISAKTLTAQQLRQARTWQITKAQEARFLNLMQGRDGLYYRHKAYTPVQILGLNAKSDKARDHYAALAVTQRLQRVGKELAFYAAYAKAYAKTVRRLHLPLLRQFNPRPFSPLNQLKFQLKSGDVVLLFVSSQMAIPPSVTNLLYQVMQTAGVHLNIYFENPSVTKADIERWAHLHSIDAHLVNTGVITLNFDNGLWAKLKAHYTLPALFLERDGKTIVLKPGTGA